MGLFSRIKKTLAGGDDAAGATSETVEAQSGTASPAASPHASASVPPPVAPSVPAAAAPSASADSSAVLDALKDKIVEFSNGQIERASIDLDSILFDFGYVDSLSAVTLISFIDEQYKVSVTELDLVGSLNTLQALSDHVERLTSNA